MTQPTENGDLHSLSLGRDPSDVVLGPAKG